MSSLFPDTALETVIALLVKATAVMLAATVANAMARRRVSAAARHLLWTFTVVGLLLLPVLAVALPAWVLIPLAPPSNESVQLGAPQDEILTASSTDPTLSTVAAGPVAVAHTDPLSPGVSWRGVLSGVYAAGVLLLLLQLEIQRRAIQRLVRHATEVNEPDWRRLLIDCARRLGVQRPVRLVHSDERTMPMTCGIRHPAIVIPAIADGWTEDRRRAVLLHELAHVLRYDCLTQMLAAVACAFYWINPLTWWIARRLRVERELACDDRVLTVGTHARDYADHLLEIAFALGRSRMPAIAVSMARPGQLEGRMLAVLDEARNRSSPGVRGALAGAIGMAVLVLPLAGARAAVVVTDTYEEPAMIVQPSLEASTTPAPPAARQVAADARMQDGLPGTWEIRPAKTAGMVYLRLTERDWSTGTTVPMDRFEGLSAALSGGSGPVKFTLRRDAGSFLFEGVFRAGVGGGTFTYAPNPAFPAELAKRGLTAPTASQQYSLARHDVGLALVDELKKQDYSTFDTAQLVRAGEHGVHLTYVREMADLGYRFNALDVLIKQRDHGITPTLVRELATEGYKNLSADGLLRARDHGVTPEFVGELRAAGYGSLAMDQLVNARDHGVSAEFAREMTALGYAKLPLQELIRARDHGISPEFAREMSALGYAKLPLPELIRARDHGVSATFVRELKDLGYDKLDIDVLVGLRDHGVTAERIRNANARAGTKLPLDMLKALAAGGMR